MGMFTLSPQVVQASTRRHGGGGGASDVVGHRPLPRRVGGLRVSQRVNEMTVLSLRL